MILQNFIFPKKEICKETELYYRVIHKKEAVVREGNVAGKKNVAWDKNVDWENRATQESGFFLPAEGEYSFFTYFNSFSLEKWVYYTGITGLSVQLFLCGKGTVFLEQEDLEQRTSLLEQNFNFREKKELRLSVPEIIRTGILYVKIKMVSDGHFYQGAFLTNEAVKQEVKLAIGICTYQRERELKKTVGNLQKKLFFSEKAPLYQKLRIYISDNDSHHENNAAKWNPEHVVCLKNKNAGGSGGFARCMLEALREQKAQGFTHFLFMDDDIILEPETVYRTYALFSMAKKEFLGHALGGSLLRKEKPFIQYAKGECFENGRIHTLKKDFDLRREELLLRNEQEEPVDYNGWWYCCIPFGTGLEQGMPLPLFLHADDIEFGLRFRKRFMTLNGIGVWHASFENRKASYLEYYDMRNFLILNAVHFPEYTWKKACKRVFRHLVYLCLKYRYLDEEICLRGVKDFCLGIEFLKNTEPERLHEELIKEGYIFEDKKEILKKREVQALPVEASSRQMFRVKRVLYYEPETGKGFETERRYRELFRLLKNLWRAYRILRKGYQRAAVEYRNRVGEITNVDFWKKYLER